MHHSELNQPKNTEQTKPISVDCDNLHELQLNWGLVLNINVVKTVIIVQLDYPITCC
jgi:hypothetical protein